MVVIKVKFLPLEPPPLNIRTLPIMKLSNLKKSGQILVMAMTQAVVYLQHQEVEFTNSHAQQ